MAICGAGLVRGGAALSQELGFKPAPLEFPLGIGIRLRRSRS